MTHDEWESLCDGCGLCCLQRLEDEDSGDIVMTSVSCRYLDHKSCACTDYANRQTNVPACLKVTKENIPHLHWMPETCAYRLVANGSDLPNWHYLVCGDKEAVHREGISLSGKMISEDDVDDIEEYVVE